MPRSPALLALALLMSLPSCSGKKAGPTVPAYPDRDSFCHEWAVRNCNPAVIDGCLASSADACIAGAEANCVAKIPEGKYSAAAANTCLAAVDHAYADGVVSTADRDVLVDFGGDCAKIVSGSGGTDDPCADDSDCNREVDLACVKKAGAAAGLCEKPNLVDNGASCSASDAVCNAGYYCDTGSHCVEGGAEGTPCSPSEPCTTGFRCGDMPVGGDAGASPDAGASSGQTTCKALGQRGAACETDAECASQICVLTDPKKNTSACDDQIRLVPGSKICASIQ